MAILGWPMKALPSERKPIPQYQEPLAVLSTEGVERMTPSVMTTPTGEPVDMA